MILPFDEDYRIKSETQQWIIQKSQVVKGKTVWKNFRFFSQLEYCIRDLSRILIRELETEGIQESVAAIEELCLQIAEVFAPVLEIRADFSCLTASKSGERAA
jgi:hypothetical protein